MFEFRILLINVVLPSAITIIAILAVCFLTRGNNQGAQPIAAESDQRNRITEHVGASLQSIAAVLAIWAAFGLRTDFSVWHEDAWMRLPLGTAIVGLTAAITTWIPGQVIVWTLRFLACLLAAYLVFPQGDAWEFLLPMRSLWLSAISLSCIVGWYLIDRRSAKEAAVLGLGWITLFASSAYLTSESFLKVTELLLAVSSVIGCVSLASLAQPSLKLVSAASGPSLFTLAAVVATAQFNSFLGFPDRLSWLAMFSPALAALFVLPLRSNDDVSGSLSKRYVVFSILVCLALAALIAGWTATLGVGGEDWE